MLNNVNIMELYALICAIIFVRRIDQFFEKHYEKPLCVWPKIEFNPNDQAIIDVTKFLEMISHYKSVLDKRRKLPGNYQ